MRLAHTLLRVALLASSLSIEVASAQGPAPARPLGIRELRAELLAPPFADAWVAATSDGLVQLSFEQRAPDMRFDLPRESDPVREFFHPREVLNWVDEASRAIEWIASRPSEASSASTWTRTLGRPNGVVFQLRGELLKGVPRLTIVVNRCRRSGDEREVRADILTGILSAFRRVAMDAQSVVPRALPDEPVWYEHAVSCPAQPLPDNQHPPWPRVGSRQVRPHQELVQFVVSAEGAVEPGSARFLPSSDARFAAAIRGVLAQWRFAPATRMGQPVRQLVHINVGFRPPIALAPGGRTCPGEVASSPLEGSTCDVLFTAPLRTDVVSVLPQGDGQVRIANSAESRPSFLLSERREHTAVVVPATQFREFIDTVRKLLPTLDTSSVMPALPDREYAPAAPMIGAQDSLGLNMWLSPTGWIRAGYWCGPNGPGQSRLLEVTPGDFAKFRHVADAALERTPLQARWSSGNRPYVEYELTCDVARRGIARFPTLPDTGAGESSREVLARVTVDTMGRVEPGSIEIMPGADNAARRIAIATLSRWAFRPGVIGHSRVRAQTHVSLILRPRDADAFVLAATPRPLPPDDPRRRTIFYPVPSPAPSPLSPPPRAAERRDTTRMPPPVWRDSIRYGGGPSVGNPPYDGGRPPARWCLEASGQAPGDFGHRGGSWIDVSRSWLREVLSDTSDLGDGWRKVLGGAPRLAPTDSISQIFDESECRAIAEMLALELTGAQPWPVVVLRVRDYLIAFPSNVRRGEFGVAVGMDPRRVIRGIATW